MTCDEALARNIQRLLASTASLPASKPRRESQAKRRARALRQHPIETEATDALNRRYAGS
jgi:hypothetical protein